MENGTLIVGYGNAYCHDDGVALYIINELRHRLGIRELQPDEDGLDDLGHELDSILLHQLIPEIVPIVANYQLVIFVDAHGGSIQDDVRMVQVEEEHRFHAVTHHMSPGMILGMARKMNIAPAGYLVSVRGNNFDFGLGLSDPCRRCADIAIQKILELEKGWVRSEVT
jgi:hydrogenase maturation protease